MTSTTKSFVRGFLAVLLIFLSAKGFADNSRPASEKCIRGLTHSFQGIDLSPERMPPGVLSAAIAIGIDKYPLFKSYELSRLSELLSSTPTATMEIDLAEAEPSEHFDLHDPGNHGTVAARISDASLLTDRAQALLSSLSLSEGEVSLDSSTIRESDVGLKNQRVLKSFLDRFSAATSATKEQLDLIKVVLEKMVESAYRADCQHNHPRRSLAEIYVRWKKDGKGKDVDLAHTDPETYSVSTLALVGLGTEHFIREGNRLKIQTTPTGMIVHMFGDLSGQPVLHRSSTKRGPRLVFLLFWR